MVTEATLQAVCFLIYFLQSHLAVFSTSSIRTHRKGRCSFRGKCCLFPSPNLNQRERVASCFFLRSFFPNSNIALPRPRSNVMLSISAVPNRQRYQLFPASALVPRSLGRNCSTHPAACGEAPAAANRIRLSQALAAAIHPSRWGCPTRAPAHGPRPQPWDKRSKLLVLCCQKDQFDLL